MMRSIGLAPWQARRQVGLYTRQSEVAILDDLTHPVRPLDSPARMAESLRMPPRHTRSIRAPWLLAALAVVGGGLVAASAQIGSTGDPEGVATGLHQLFLHDPCTGDYPPQPDTCIHAQLLEKTVTAGGKTGVVYDVRLRIRGLFEPTTIMGGETPDEAHPYYKVGGTVRARDWSAWHITVSNPPQTYWLNHYPRVSHTIYLEDFETTIPIAGGATVVARVVDDNDRQMDNHEPGLPDRMQIIKGVVDAALPGQMLRLDVVRVTAR
jgi:hypothetical protein